MLVLSRREGEEIVIAGNIRVVVVSSEGGRIRLGISAPPSVSVNRKEVEDRRRPTPHLIGFPAPTDMLI
jgi:carbon storage regulator